MKVFQKRLYGLIFIAYFLTCFISYPAANGWEEEPPAGYIERMAKGEEPGWVPPSIEDLTQGKVKIGDLIDKDNVNLVKDYLTPSIYECVKDGMVLSMAENIPPEKMIPRFFWEATVRNQGKAVMDENGTVYLKDGSPWPGGIPFLDPQTPLEVMADLKFGVCMDDHYALKCPMWYISKDGKIEKEARNEIWQLNTTGRLKVPPIGAITGQENIQWRCIQFFTEPLEMKGLGQLTIRHYDEYKEPDEGFAYLPAFKRIIRVSATTYQDNVGGTDFTYGDPHGIREPYAYWDFKSMDKKLMLWPGPKTLVPWATMDGDVPSDVLFDKGYKYPRGEWAILPVLVVEAVPKIKHIYGKKVLYVFRPPYWTAKTYAIRMVDIYDRQMQMWKSHFSQDDYTTKDEESVGSIPFYDLQTGHASNSFCPTILNSGVQMRQMNLTTLLQLGR